MCNTGNGLINLYEGFFQASIDYWTIEIKKMTDQWKSKNNTIYFPENFYQIFDGLEDLRQLVYQVGPTVEQEYRSTKVHSGQSSRFRFLAPSARLGCVPELGAAHSTTPRCTGTTVISGSRPSSSARKTFKLG